MSGHKTADATSAWPPGLHSIDATMPAPPEPPPAPSRARRNTKKVKFCIPGVEGEENEANSHRFCNSGDCPGDPLGPCGPSSSAAAAPAELSPPISPSSVAESSSAPEPPQKAAVWEHLKRQGRLARVVEGFQAVAEDMRQATQAASAAQHEVWQEIALARRLHRKPNPGPAARYNQAQFRIEQLNSEVRLYTDGDEALSQKWEAICREGSPENFENPNGKVRSSLNQGFQGHSSER